MKVESGIGVGRWGRMVVSSSSRESVGVWFDVDAVDDAGAEEEEEEDAEDLER